MEKEAVISRGSSDLASSLHSVWEIGSSGVRRISSARAGADPGGGRWGGRPPLGKSFTIQNTPFNITQAAVHHWAPTPGRNPVSAPEGCRVAKITPRPKVRAARVIFVDCGGCGAVRNDSNIET